MKEYREWLQEMDRTYDYEIFLEEMEGSIVTGQREHIDLKVLVDHHRVLSNLFVKLSGFNQRFYDPYYAGLEREVGEREVGERIGVLEKEIDNF